MIGNSMVKLGILITKQYRLLSVAALLDVFETVNKFYAEAQQPAFFEIELIHDGTLFPGMHNQYPLRSLEGPGRYGLVLIPAFASCNMDQAIESNRKALEWLLDQYQCGAEIASFCTGAFLLAASGLLDRKLATTHVDASSRFSAAFPAVKLLDDAVVTEDQGIYTSGGATSTFHLLLRLIENYCSRDMAIRTAKYFAIDMDRERQSCFRRFQPEETQQDPLVQELQQRIKNDYAKVNTIEELLCGIPASRRNLARRFKLVTGLTPIGYLQKTRIEAAKKVLEHSPAPVLESMITAGYNDEKAFRQLFKKMVGMTPSAYRNKFSMRPAALV
jgi:transcriptional regulator GlxA family with amidase domain